MSRSIKPHSGWLNLGRSLTKIVAEEVTENVEADSTSAPGLRYNVCRDKTSDNQKYVFPRPISDKPERDEGGHYADLTQSQSIAGGNGYRTFEASTTYKNVILPLKSSKLADPFPAPVKMMPSHTVSDQEKAEQMLAERRIPDTVTKRRY